MNEYSIEVTDVRIRKIFDDDKLKALVSVTINNCLVIHEVKIVKGNGKLFAAMPSRKDDAGIFHDIVHPINSEIRSKIETEIIDAYERYIIAAEVN